jgi:hypothetical protein
MIGIIYGIYHNTKLIYIGSTYERMSQRKSKHKYSMKNNTSETNKLYVYMNKYNYDEFSFKKIIEKEFENKSAMIKEE